MEVKLLACDQTLMVGQKEFDVDLQLTGEAATLARYGGFSKANRGTSRIDGKKDLGLEAWNILTSKKSHEDV